MREFLEFVIRQLIEFPDDIVLTEIPSGRTTVFKLQLRRGDVGRVIGRGGQTIQAIRALLASSAARHGVGRLWPDADPMAFHRNALQFGILLK